MSSNIIDPENASADLDALTLSKWEIDNRVTMNLKLVGGLGRINTPDGVPHTIDPVGTIEVERTLPEMDDEDFEEVSNILGRWQAVGTPLRLLEFEDTLMVVEDGQNYLALPPGPTLGSSAAAL